MFDARHAEVSAPDGRGASSVLCPLIIDVAASFPGCWVPISPGAVHPTIFAAATDRSQLGDGGGEGDSPANGGPRQGPS